MKKIIATLIAVVVLVACFATVTALAATPSPSTKPTHQITITTYANGEEAKGTYTSLEDGSIKLDKTENSKEEFTGWVIEVINPDGSAAPAQENVHYVIISGKLSSDDLVIKPLANLHIEESYNVKGSAGDKGNTNDSPVAPPTGSKAVASVAVLTVLALAGAVAVKKVRV